MEYFNSSRIHNLLKLTWKIHQYSPNSGPSKTPQINLKEKIVQYLLSDHIEIKLEINNKKIAGKHQDNWILHTIYQNNI